MPSRAPSSPADPPRRRADARENAERIVEAAITCLQQDPKATMSEIAVAAGVGRVTLYGHFSSREELVEVALVRALADGDRVLASLDLTGDPRAALVDLIEASWSLTAKAGAVLEAAQEVLPPGRVQALHAEPARRVEDLIRRGQATGVLRTDLRAEWLASTLHHLMKGAAADVARGALPVADAPRLISTIADAAFAAPRPTPPSR